MAGGAPFVRMRSVLSPTAKDLPCQKVHRLALPDGLSARGREPDQIVLPVRQEMQVLAQSAHL